jgi:hypothetical protein
MSKHVSIASHRGPSGHSYLPLSFPPNSPPLASQLERPGAGNGVEPAAALIYALCVPSDSTLLLGSPHLSVSSSISIRFIFSVYFSIHSVLVRLECTHSLREYLNCRPARHSARRLFISYHHHHIRSRSGSSLNRQYAIHILRSVRSEHWLCSRYVPSNQIEEEENS